ncbi:MAG TPA: (2Fe-2S)-binding protein [Thermoplasmatales archaeon]|nr:(2Fe-2S)-binding protein [Candidatus Thermoplasmatota archaeon]HDS59444.1 (2Fe-2S)-binding protein [Thermoplasmatales archaeon]
MTIICRCEDVSEEEIMKAIEEGCRTLDELKHRLRLGMGPCQGRTCLPLAARILARETGQTMADVQMQTSRPPAVPVALGLLAGDSRD